jgi:hypothetical protein
MGQAGELALGQNRGLWRRPGKRGFHAVKSTWAVVGLALGEQVGICDRAPPEACRRRGRSLSVDDERRRRSAMPADRRHDRGRAGERFDDGPSGLAERG